MKTQKTAAAVLVFAAMAFSGTALADVYQGGLGAGTGPYVQGDLGLGHVKAKSDFNSVRDTYNESKLLPRASVGYDFGQVRTAVDYTHYGKIDEGNNGAYASTKAQGVGVAAIYDFDQYGQVQPYVGARVAANRIKRIESAAGFSRSERETKAGVGVLAGVGYQLDNTTTFDAGYRYNRFDSNLKAHEATVGVRYKF